MFNFQRFSVFGSKSLGQIFLPQGVNINEKNTLIPSINHGRSSAVKINDYEWILVKGGGWNYKGPTIYKIKKDQEFIMGLYDYNSAIREYLVSKEIEKITDDFPKVINYKKICDFKLPKKYDFLKTITYANGKKVEPTLIYTKVKCPFRVKDLEYLNLKEKNEIIKKCCKYWKIKKKDFIKTFSNILGEHVGLLHKNNFINDTLEYSNVTLLAEIVDYELVTAPNILFSDGTYGLEIQDERREKEILYGAEIILELSHLLYQNKTFFYCYQEFIHGYNKYNKNFVEKTKSIEQMLKREKIIL